jgi:hypothetical protein
MNWFSSHCNSNLLDHLMSLFSPCMGGTTRSAHRLGEAGIARLSSSCWTNRLDSDGFHDNIGLDSEPVELAVANYAAPFLDAAGAIRNLCIEKYKANVLEYVA